MPIYVGHSITRCNHFMTAMMTRSIPIYKYGGLRFLMMKLTGHLWVSCSLLSHSMASRMIHVAHRGSKQGIPFSTMSRSQRRASKVRHDANQRQVGVRQLSIQSVESTKSAKSQA